MNRKEGGADLSLWRRIAVTQAAVRDGKQRPPIDVTGGWQLPRDLLRKRGRRPAWVKEREAFYWEHFPPSQAAEARRLLAFGIPTGPRRPDGTQVVAKATIPAVAAKFGMSERALQRLLAKTRPPGIPWARVIDVGPGYAYAVPEGESLLSAVPLWAVELPACGGEWLYHVWACEHHDDVRRAKNYPCPHCGRRHRGRPNAVRRLRFDEVAAWRNARSHRRRQGLFYPQV
jgi:hypothetical protein